MFNVYHTPPRSSPSLFGVLLVFVVGTVQTSAQCGAGQKYITDNSNCVPCTIGKYQDNTDHTIEDCPSCPDGYHNDADASSAANHLECTSCPNGKYFHTIEDCTICGKGKRTIFNLNNEDGLPDWTILGELKKVCEDCPFGRYSADLGTERVKHTTCQQCEPGFYYFTLDTSCRECEAGMYQKQAANADNPYCFTECKRLYHPQECPKRCRRTCSWCLEGEYSDEATTDCKECAAGMYQNIGLDASTVQVCKICQFGKYAHLPKTNECTDCAAGKFLFAHDGADTVANREEHDGPNDCVLCYDGKSSGAGAQQCGECSSGQYLTGSECTKCDIGQYQVEQAQSSCELCPRGFFQIETGKALCLVCFSGQYQNDTEKTSCETCSPGYYQSETKATLCIDCPVGFQQDKAGQALCNRCTPGLYQNKSAQELCINCGAGYYQQQSEQIICIACAPGQYQNKVRQNSCVGCSAGMFAASGKSEGCEACPIGQRAGKEAKECDVCQLGKTTLQTGSKKCSACPIGRIGGPTGMCIGCREWGNKIGGKNIDKLYQDKSGRTACKECNETGFTALEVTEVSEAGDKLISTPGCVNPDYKLVSDCSERGEYLEDCEEYEKSGCKVDLKPTSTDEKMKEMLAKRTCMQCEPGMICDGASVLSARNILRRTGWYYLDSTVLLKMAENPLETRKIRESDDHTYWDEKRPEHIVNQWKYRYSTNDAPFVKENYDKTTFTAVRCPIPSHCCGAREPTAMAGSNGVSITNNYELLDENIYCQLQQLIDLEITEAGKKEILETALELGFKNYSQIYGTRIVKDDNRIVGDYIQIKYPFWNNSCAYGVDTDYPLCAKCAPGFEPTGFTKDCLKCREGEMVLRAALFSLFVVIVGVSFLLVKMNKKCRKHCGTHEFKKARGDIGRMIRLLIDFLQIVLSMEAIMPNIAWPAGFLEHMSGLNYVDLNVMDMLGIQCTYDVDYINQMYMYMSVPIAFVCFALLDLMVNKKMLNYKMVAAKNSGQLDEMWDHTLGEMFEFLLEPNKEAKIDPDAPAQVVCEHSLIDLLKISNQGSRIWSDPAKEAHSMMTRFAHHEGYLNKFEFCDAFTQVMEDRASHNSKSNKFANDSIKLQKFNLLSWSSWQKKRAAISERTFLILLIIHAPICKVVFRSLPGNCTPVADRRYLLADFGVNCGTIDSPDVRYDIASGFAITTIVLYVFGFPLAIAIYLVVKRKLLFTFRLKLMFGWIYLHYKPHLFWWTLWEVGLKVFLMGCLFFFPDNRKGFAGAIVSTFALALTSIFGPFKSRIVRALAIIKWFATSMMYLSTTQLNGSGGLDYGVMMTLMIVVYASFSIGLVLIVYRLFLALKSAHGGNAKVKVRSAVHRLAQLKHMAGSSGMFDHKHGIHLEHAMSKYDIKMKRLHSVGSADANNSSVDNLSKQKQQNRLTAVLPVNGSDGNQEGGVKQQQENQQKIKEKPEIQQEKGGTEKQEEKEQQEPQESQESQESQELTFEPQQQPAPRNIGKGWWQTYDQTSQKFYYSNVDGKPTTWHWPAEIPQEDFSSTAQQSIKDWDTGRKGGDVKRRPSGKLRKKMTVEQVSL